MATHSVFNEVEESWLPKSVYRLDRIEVGQGGIPNGLEALVVPNIGRQRTDGGSEFAGLVWVGPQVRQGPPVGADGEQDGLRLWQARERLALAAYDEALARIFRRDGALMPLPLCTAICCCRMHAIADMLGLA